MSIRYTAIRQQYKKLSFQVYHQKNFPSEIPVTLLISQYAVVAVSEENKQLLSRFYMHDLVKITSRKTHTKQLTMYFRLPTFHDYVVNGLEVDIFDSIGL
jgi:hypothetical protein